MMLLAFETSCDDTCAAVLSDGPAGMTLCSNIVSSQLVHAAYAGIVPELASREHIRALGPVMRRALDEAGTDLAALDAVAVTNGPGLIGSLLVGISFAKALAYGRGIPVIGINHIEGHLAGAVLEYGEQRASPPFIGLVASGGHTEIMRVTEWGVWELLGATRDDAAGEAFDKVAKLLDLGFPGGPPLSRAAAGGRSTAFDFPRAWLDLDRGGLEFSFSGLKTAIKLFLDRQGWPARPADPAERRQFVCDVAASFEAAVVDVLCAKLWKATELAGIAKVVVSGGVAANGALRSRLAAEAAARPVDLLLPAPALCGDNAAMIAVVGMQRLRRGESSGYNLPAVPNLDDWTGHYRVAD